MTDIILKQGTGVPSDTDVEVAEVALDTSSGAMYTKLADGSVKHLNPVSTGGGGESLWEQSGDDIYYNDGKVRINTNHTAGNGKFQVKQSEDANLAITNVGSGGVGIAGITDFGGANVPVGYNASQHEFQIRGTEAMRINADGNVVTGSDPSYVNNPNGTTLRPDGTVYTNNVQLADNSGSVGGNSPSIYSPAPTTLAISTARAERMRIDSNGNVGVGTESPNGKLDVASVDSSSYDSTAPSADIIVSRKNTSNDASTPAGIRFDVTGFSGTTTGGAAINAIQSGNASSASLAFLTRDRGAWGERMRIDANGRVGIGGEAGARTIDEAKALAKTKLTEWKAEVKKRTAEQPEASTQEITLEVTGGDFDAMPTEQALAEFLQGRVIGGGNAKLQVSGDGYFSGTVFCVQSVHKDFSGLYYGTEAVLPLDGNAGYVDNKISLGDTNYKFKDAHFSGTVNAGGDVVAYSDERLKDNVETLDGSKVFEMRGVSFDKDGRASSGVIAQELQKVAPELVHDDGEYLSVAYGNLVGYLIEAVKELKAEVEALKRG